MAKVSFTKLGLNKNQEVKTITWNEQIIEIKQYLPIAEKLELISNVINFAHDGSANFANPVQVDVYTALEVLYAYTNINFTDKQKEDVAKLYDLVKGSGLLHTIIEEIPEEEYNEVVNGIYRSIDSIYTYRNSAMGIMEAVSADYKNLELDANAIHEKLSDADNLTLLKDIVDKMG